MELRVDMELKKVKKNVLCLIVIGLLDLRARGKSDVTSAERGGVFGDLRLSRFLQSGEEESQCGWCVVSSFAPPLSLSLRAGVLVCGCRFPSFDLAPLSRNLSFIAFLSFDQIWFSLFFTAKVTDWSKITFYITFWFFDKFHRHFAMRWSFAQKPLFFPFWRKSQHR